jgi:DNA-binding MarR family transcriptional regulator
MIGSEKLRAEDEVASILQLAQQAEDLNRQLRHLATALDTARQFSRLITSPASPSVQHKVQGPPQVRVRRYLRQRRAREAAFPAGTFSDPAWDILLDLYASDLEGRRVSVSSACFAAAVPPTTALRWIRKLVEDGALTRVQDPKDGRRVYVTLSEYAWQSMDHWVSQALL